ncbi:hypothetical protein K466DRAFT_112938 [Polyporus arcularius HHB13444]|uniref:Uncharacterized protein n=1 Tax=Polyporus arcularius HHB13444 TaxID=1314778 RepID=A0A5C3PDN1_9APHY|nr:hypothetical protein K466DRAFT_112938 [Polyporus arcularius HHB13444]
MGSILLTSQSMVKTSPPQVTETLATLGQACDRGLLAATHVEVQTIAAECPLALTVRLASQPLVQSCGRQSFTHAAVLLLHSPDSSKHLKLRVPEPCLQRYLARRYDTKPPARYAASTSTPCCEPGCLTIRWLEAMFWVPFRVEKSCQDTGRSTNSIKAWLGVVGRVSIRDSSEYLLK